MSYAATTWAIQQRGLKPVAWRILVCLADRHNPDHGCFPSQVKLAHDAEVSKATLNRHLDDLQKRGLIIRLRRIDHETGQQKATRYLLGFEEEFTQYVEEAESQVETRKTPSPSLKNGQTRVSKNAIPESHSCETLTSKGTSKGTSKTHMSDFFTQTNDEPEPQTAAPSADLDELAETFWKLWPAAGRARTSRKLVRAALVKCKVRGVDLEKLERCAKAYLRTKDATKDDHAYVPGLHAWLNKERYDAFMERVGEDDAAVSELRWRAAIDDYLQRGHWDRTKMGPPPGEAGCRAPQHLVN